MGRGLKAAGVVASVDAFIEAAGANPQARTIQAGFYPLLKEMKASDVVAVLVDPDKIVTTNVTIPEGLRVKDIVDLLAENTDFPKADFEKALQDPEALGLPGVRRGQPGGLPVPGDVRLRPRGEAGRHAPRHGRRGGSRRPPRTTWRPAPRRSATRRRRS